MWRRGLKEFLSVFFFLNTHTVCTPTWNHPTAPLSANSNNCQVVKWCCYCVPIATSFLAWVTVFPHCQLENVPSNSRSTWNFLAMQISFSFPLPILHILKGSYLYSLRRMVWWQLSILSLLYNSVNLSFQWILCSFWNSCEFLYHLSNKFLKIRVSNISRSW